MMDQRVSEQQYHRLPSADDICFILSLVRNPNNFIAEHHHTTTQSFSVHKLSSSWQQTLTLLPGQRREIILSLKKLATARQKWGNVSKTAGHDVVNELQQRYIEPDVLEEVESAASTIRICSTQYLESMQDYIKTLQQQFWYHRSISIGHKGNFNASQLVVNVGSQLSSQLISQLRWDERLITHGIISYLNDELYNINSNNDKLIIWSESMSSMLKIDKSYWSFVEREVYDETIEIDEEEDGKNNPNRYLNGEHSTQYINVSSSTLLEENQQNDVTTTVDDRVHDCIVSSTSVEEAVDAFFMSNSCRNRKSKCLTSILLVGEEGCGKTHLLNTIQQQHAQSNNIKIFRPSREELIGTSIGSTEDRLIALFTYATRFIATSSKEKGRKCLLMLDDIDRVFSLSDDMTNDSSDANVPYGSTQHHYVGRRCKALFITMLDAFREHSKSIQGNGHLLLLCTSRSSCGEAVDRFDVTYTRGQLDEKQRHQIIRNCIYLETDQALDEDDETDIEEIVSLIVHHSAGRSAYELSQFCREAIMSCAKSSTSQAKAKSNSTNFKQRLQCLDKMLQTKSPQSVRGGSLDGVVDMTVLTPDELQSQLTIDANGDAIMPLLGAEAKRAQEALMNVVITPLCRSDEIRTLLYGGGDTAALDSKPLRVGALLAGIPGVGKTSLAYHCAALAAKMSRISLLDVSCTSLIHKEMGGSERAVQHLFRAVRAAAPCIVLLDGIESVALCRGNDTTSEGTMDRVLSTFLTEMDGIETDISGNIAFIGITHNPDLIDPSLLRPGRLEKIISFQPPDYEARKELVSRQIQEIDFDFTTAGYFDAKTKDDISNYVAMSSAGMSAVEVIAICKEASMSCLRELNFEVTGKPRLRFDHFKNSVSIMKGKAGH